jgi:23S rRNA (uracil1939-C5)-methyltransferase
MNSCPHFSKCSGCELVDFLNPPIWKEALAFFREQNIEPQFVHEGFSQTRLKAKLAVRPGPEIGLFKKNTHDVLSIPDCHVHHPAINRAVAILKEEMIRHKVIPYRENPPSGQLRYVQMFVERETGKIQLTLVVNHGDLDPFCKALLKHDLWHSIWINGQSDRTNRIFGDSWKLYFGEPFLWQRLNEMQIPFHPGAFSQTHLPLFEKMLRKIESWVNPGERVIELYAGVGAIGLSVQQKAKELALVENNPFAHLSFKQMKIDVPYHCIDAKEADLAGYDLIIVDPPRKGLDPQIIPKLDASRLIYVSCGFESFRRDCKELFSRGWKIKEANGYLLFPGTNHVETLALFEKK